MAIHSLVDPRAQITQAVRCVALVHEEARPNQTLSRSPGGDETARTLRVRLRECQATRAYEPPAKSAGVTRACAYGAGLAVAARKSTSESATR